MPRQSPWESSERPVSVTTQWAIGMTRRDERFVARSIIGRYSEQCLTAGAAIGRTPIEPPPNGARLHTRRPRHGAERAFHGHRLTREGFHACSPMWGRNRNRTCVSPQRVGWSQGRPPPPTEGPGAPATTSRAPAMGSPPDASAASARHWPPASRWASAVRSPRRATRCGLGSQHPARRDAGWRAPSLRRAVSHDLLPLRQCASSGCAALPPGATPRAMPR